MWVYMQTNCVRMAANIYVYLMYVMARRSAQKYPHHLHILLFQSIACYQNIIYQMDQP